MNNINEILSRLDFNEWDVDLYKVPITWCEMYDIRDYIEKLEKQLEAYENMRKEAIKYIHDKFDRFDCDGNLGISMQISYCEEDLLNILNKVGGSDE